MGWTSELGIPAAPLGVQRPSALGTAHLTLMPAGLTARVFRAVLFPGAKVKGKRRFGT